MQLGTTVDSRRLVVRVGNFSVIDFFDKNSYSGDLRRQFLNMAFMTYAAFDFAADARGYTWGMVSEYFHDDWAMRFGHVATSVDPNQLPIDSRIFTYYGQQVELEHRHQLYGQARLRKNAGFTGIMKTWANSVMPLPLSNPTIIKMPQPAPALIMDQETRAPRIYAGRANPMTRVGIGINIEQQVLDDVGLFFRGMYSDGKTEVFSYTSTDRSISLGALANGSRWGRKKDLLGIGFAAGWISSQHARYLNMGGIDGFIGDGRIKKDAEHVVDIFYSVNVLNSRCG